MEKWPARENDKLILITFSPAMPSLSPLKRHENNKKKKNKCAIESKKVERNVKSFRLAGFVFFPFCICVLALILNVCVQFSSGMHSKRATFVFDILCGFYGIWCRERRSPFVIFVKLSKGSFFERQHPI